MSSAAEAITTTVPLAPLPSAVAAPPAARSPWLVNPAFDLFFLANLFWPILVILHSIYGTPLGSELGFWAAYVLLTPHRWITLALVFLDGERFEQRSSAYLWILVAAAAAVVGLASLDLIALILIIDFFWNTWHFAAQHSGIGRIYGRIARPDLTGAALLEKVLLRAFVVYVLVRLAMPLMSAQEVPWLTWLNAPAWSEWLKPLDLPLLVLPLVLLAREVPGFSRAALGRVIYLASVCFLYSFILVSVHFAPQYTTLTPFLGGLLLSVVFFHSTEYLAIVSWSVHKRHAKSKSAIFGWLVPRWGLALVVFMAVLGLTAWLIDQRYQRFWLLLTMFVSFLHYAYDGMIWKVRRPASAAAVS